jgi:hypothetical protein
LPRIVFSKLLVAQDRTQQIILLLQVAAAAALFMAAPVVQEGCLLLQQVYLQESHTQSQSVQGVRGHCLHQS